MISTSSPSFMTVDGVDNRKVSNFISRTLGMILVKSENMSNSFIEGCKKHTTTSSMLRLILI